MSELSHDERKRLIKEHEKALKELLKGCTHRFRPLTAKEQADEWMSVSASCDICGEHFGWRCKVSPDEVCHYHTSVVRGKGRGVYLERNQGFKLLSELPVPHDFDPEYENSDSCIFCGQPDERK